MACMISHPVVASLVAEPRDVLLIGMSGIGKTRLSRHLTRCGTWRYVSIDGEIQGRHLREELLSAFHAKNNQRGDSAQLRELDPMSVDLETHSDSLAPLTAYLGMPGDPSKGGLEFAEYVRRQDAHRQAERRAIEDLVVLGTDQPVLADASGSFCEVFEADDPVLDALRERFMFVSLRENDALITLLIERFKAQPKPIYYPPDLLVQYWEEYAQTYAVAPAKVDPQEFALWAYEKLVAARRAKYAALAERSDASIDAAEL